MNIPEDCTTGQELADAGGYNFIIGAMIAGRFVPLEMERDRLGAETRREVLMRKYEQVIVVERKKKVK